MILKLPRTVTGLAITGFLLAAMPLLLALLVAELALQQLSAQTEALLNDSIAMTRLGDQLFNQVDDVERSARQYAVLGDDDLAEIVEKRWQATEDTLEKLAVQVKDPSSMAAIDALQRDEHQAHLD